MYLTLTIRTGSDAVQTYEDIGEVLKLFIDQELEDDTSEPKDGHGYPIYDKNGDRVGDWYVEDTTA